MNERPCIRCHNSVVLEDGHLVYCTVCGAPQIFLSEELQEQIAGEVRAYTASTSEPAPQPGQSPAPGEQDPRPWNLPGSHRGAPWRKAVEYALLSAAVALVLGLAAIAVPTLNLLMVLWVISAPVLTVGIVSARSPQAPAGSGFAARLGLLTGLLVAAGCAVVFTLTLVITRFALHHGAVIDAQISGAVQEAGANAAARVGAAAQPMLGLFNIPEFRVGFLLWGLTASAFGYLLLSTLAAGVAGLVLKRRRGV